MIEMPDPKSPPNKMDCLVHGGPDCARHPIITACIVGHGNGDPGEQARNYLRSMLNAGKMSEQEFKDWWRELVAWENAGNKVNMLAPLSAADHPYATRRR